ncbi:hypothetical protein SBA6_300013 [Candidatus Sulfopaludibacter sp. SbA6]|nr:hypothetical protein SBA6_300013 [Candidatus Sulfopaludibacter sp. SbA6]
MNLTLTAAEEARSAAKAQAQGTTPEALVRQAIEPVIGATVEPAGPQSQSHPITTTLSSRPSRPIAGRDRSRL